jgi:uncharacterized membrane protein
MATTIVSKRKILPIFMMIGAFILAITLNIHIVVIILSCAAIGILVTLLASWRERKNQNAGTAP